MTGRPQVAPTVLYDKQLDKLEFVRVGGVCFLSLRPFGAPPSSEGGFGLYELATQR